MAIHIKPNVLMSGLSNTVFDELKGDSWSELVMCLISRDYSLNYVAFNTSWVPNQKVIIIFIFALIQNAMTSSNDYIRI